MTTNKITYSSELMKNYVQTEFMSPQAKFEALQTGAGLSLLFSMGTDNVFYVTGETQGSSSAGWERTDLSSAQIVKDFSGKTGVKCKTFDAAQNIADGTIGLAMVVNDGLNDCLYLCLGNSNSDPGWINNPKWVAYPFDNTTNRPSTIVIINVFLSETKGGQYILADIIRDPASARKLVSRYYIDANKTGGQAWCMHNITIDLEETGYSSCLGRQKRQSPLDGLYTCGQIGGSPQFIYQPLYNIWDPKVTANSVPLSLPNNLTPQAIASCRNSDQTTDLYATANNDTGLYYFSSALTISDQTGSAQGVLLFQNSLFTGVSRLFAYSVGGKIIVWGLNQANQVFYTSCPVDQITTKGAWSCPVPILSGVDLISPYVNCVNGGNTFFAVGGNTLYKMAQSPGTTLWAKQGITLPPPALNTPAQSFSSYTTRIQLTDGNNQPVANAPLLLSAASRGSFYINNLFYILDTKAIPVDTDALGGITIIEWVNTLQGTQLTVSEAGGNAIQINPMDKPFQKLVQLDSVSKLQSAVITNITKPDGSHPPLVAPGTSQDALQAVATANQSLKAAYDKVSSPSYLRTFAAGAKSHASALEGFPNSIFSFSDIGDVFSYLESGVENVVAIVEDEATGIYNFVATIAGEAYTCALDCVEKVVGALQWVFKVIVTAIEDVIKYLEFLFEWPDITRTKKVMQNLINLYLQDQINGIATLKNDFDKMIETARTAINNWAGIKGKGWDGLGSAATAPLSSQSQPASGLSSPTTLLSHHYQHNAANLTTTSPLPSLQPGQNPVAILLGALEKEGGVLSNTLDQLETLANEAATLSLGQILEKLIAILSDTVLGSAQVVIDALFDILIELASSFMDTLNTRIYIPVVSDILSDFGVPSLSYLDLFCWIAAVPVTVVFKAAANTAPFPDNAGTTFLINATDLKSVVQTLNPSKASVAATPNLSTSIKNGREELQAGETALQPATNADAAFGLDLGNGNVVYICGLAFAGFMTLMSCFINPFEAATPATEKNDFSIPSAVMGITAGASAVIANFVNPICPIKNDAVLWVRKVTGTIRLLAKIIFSGKAQSSFGAASGVMKNLKANDGRATGAIVDSILVIPALFCTIWHFVELSGDSVSAERSAAIIDETSNITSYCSRICYAVAVNDDDPDSQKVWIGLMVIFTAFTGGLEIAEAVVASYAS